MLSKEVVPKPRWQEEYPVFVVELLGNNLRQGFFVATLLADAWRAAPGPVEFDDLLRIVVNSRIRTLVSLAVLQIDIQMRIWLSAMKLMV